MKTAILEMMVFFSIYLYNATIIKNYEGVVNFRFNRKKVNLFFSIIIPVIFICMMKNRISFFYIYIVIILAYIIIYKIVFDETFGTIYILLIYQVLYSMIYIDIISLGITLLYRKNIYHIIKNYDAILFLLLSSKVMSSIILIKLANQNFYKNNLKKILINRKKIGANVIIVFSLANILLYFNYIYHYISHINNVIFIVLINKIVIYICLYFSIYMVFRIINWKEEEVLYKTKLLNVEYNNQINNKIDEYSNLLRIYNHDFKNILINIQDAIEIKDIDRAKKIIFEFNDISHYVIKDNKLFSNHTLINIVLNRLNEECRFNEINFEADCYIPKDFNISELELLNIFNNLSSNAFEACVKQNSSEKKWIKFKSYVKENKLIIYQVNSFNGLINIKNDRLITTKKNKKLHGIGVESIKHIVNSANGLSIIKLDRDLREFKFLIKIPLQIKSEYEML
ncbi:MAG: GHKL domain-containing protein [uncultured Clostridium sp.]